ncbi:hypothetical protein U6A24_04735 [Aquimarina gracilis]|uniref:DoxX family membrane protein n=1 Tax=Aquimarina gracilis TaxID=874422 RepID=A0ABU5ZSH8_9FLAO|nr:hypothetical protein [Aquimarina gracilis]MEB3344751.1 hypothetical protein [Aquimarina gracilis]
MKPLFVLVISFVLVALVLGLFRKENNFPLVGRTAMTIMLVFTAIGHFMYAEGMQAMIPDLIPFKKELVLFTGIIEVIFAIALLLPKYQVMTGWALIVFLVLVLPANINAAVENINYQTGENNGNGLNYLWFRVPLQVLFIIWVYLSAIRSSKSIQFKARN